jgi:hypothetical protein
VVFVVELVHEVERFVLVLVRHCVGTFSPFNRRYVAFGINRGFGDGKPADGRSRSAAVMNVDQMCAG